MLFRVSLDEYAVQKATALLIADDSFVYDRMNASEIDWDGPKVQSCVLDWIWKIYPYQTCYHRASSKGRETRFEYILTGPHKYFSSGFNLLSGRTPQSYRFTLPLITDVRFVIYADGRTVDLRSIPLEIN